MDQQTVVFTRAFGSPRGVVFDMWTISNHFAQWWGPKGFAIQICEIDLRRRTWRAITRSPEGIDHLFKGVYREVVMPERIVMTYDVREHRVEGNDLGKPAMEMTIIAAIEEQGGGTKLVVCNEFPTSADREVYLEMGSETEWSLSLDRLGEAIANKMSSNRKSFLIQQALRTDRKFGYTSGEQDARERFQRLAVDTYDFLVSMGADSVLPFDPWPESGCFWGKRVRRSLVPDLPPPSMEPDRIELSLLLLDRWESWKREYYEVRSRNPRLELRDMMQEMSESHDSVSFPDDDMELAIRHWIDAGNLTAPMPFDDRRGVVTPDFFNRLRELRKLCGEWPF